MTVRFAIVAPFAMLSLAGCTALTEGGMTAEGAKIRIAARQGTDAANGPELLAVDARELPASVTTAAYRDAEPKSDGAKLLRDEVLIDVTIAKAVRDNGPPSAIMLSAASAGQTHWLTIFYNNPARTIVFHRTTLSVQWLSLAELYESSVVADMPAVPRSVQRLVLGAGALPPPWPVTVGGDLREVFDIKEPAKPPPVADGSDYATVASGLRTDFPPTPQARDRDRAEAALHRLSGAADAAGIPWKVSVIAASLPIAFGVPDGSLFVSDGLVERLDETELAGVLAHLMGHERHQHAQSAAQQRNITGVALAIGGAGQLAAGGAPTVSAPLFRTNSYLVRTNSYLGLVTDPRFGYSRSEETEASATAANILAEVGLPPGALFDAMVKLRGTGQGQRISYDMMHHLQEAALDSGLLLDAGLIGR